MPIPKPTGSETEDDYMKRCMSDSTMVSEYGKNQRTAVCLATYKGKGVDMTEEIKESYEEEVENSVEVETKYLALNCEWKMPDEEEEDDRYKGTFSGYASVFGNKDLGGDVVVRGAFKESIRKKKAKNIKFLYMHKTDKPIGVFTKVDEDDRGLQVEGKLALGTQLGKETYELMKMGAITGLSIGYKVDAKGYSYDERSRRRKLKEVDLMEISAVTFPMNPKAQIRQVKGTEITIREWEDLLRDVAQLSRTESKIAAKAVIKALSQREVDDDSQELLNSINKITKQIKGEL
tara:strand:- start:747 stop:1619 length:873 start_codon:yes stop_codon:yes gene_type:complete